jgi:hypothetical protein
MSEYTLSEVKPKVFLLDFKQSYDLCMFFMRYQEFYESPSPQFRGKAWEWVDFMKWYSKKYGKGAFTYAIDWSGFNIPGEVINQIWELGIRDPNIYDYEMRTVYRECKAIAKGDFYLIGAVGKNGALKHEIAHGFFYTTPEYKKEMTKLVKALDPALRKGMNKVLSGMGYTPKVYIDECQAYLSTGPSYHFENLKITSAIRKPFIKLYKEYYNA